MASLRRNRNLLLCFDAFGTLFRPRQPIFQQYSEVARSCGLSDFTDEDVASSFKASFKDESRKHPNYGKATNMGSQQWWTNVIEGTFRPYLRGQDSKLPAALAPALLHRFNSKEGYEVFPDVITYFKNLATHKHKTAKSSRTIVGIITNSDDRVPDILSSFGLKVNSLRYGGACEESRRSDCNADLEFSVMSYDVGYEKPKREIFDAATKMLEGLFFASGESTKNLTDWDKVYIGDELEKDGFGAIDAGWEAILVDREDAYPDRSSIARKDRSVQIIKSFATLNDLIHP